MRDKIDLGTLLDREAVLDDGIAILAECHRMATRLTWNGPDGDPGLTSCAIGGSLVDHDIEVLVWHALNDRDLGVIGGGRVAWTYCCPGQGEDSGNQ